MNTAAIDWHGCYDDNWRGVITDDAFAHPAKFARGLIDRILHHGLAEGWWRPGDLLADPFGGIGTGGICAAYKGLRWVGCELEPRFVAMANANFRLHARTWAHFNQGYITKPTPQIIQGDSRKFAEIVAAHAVVTSPPYISGGHHPDQTGAWNTNGRGQSKGGTGLGSKEGAGYGATPGQIGQLQPGDISGAVTSPPYAKSIESRGDGIDWDKTCRTHRGSRTNGRGAIADGYGAEAANIGNLKEGVINGAVTSPPWQNRFDGANDVAEKGKHSSIAIERAKKDYIDYNASGTHGQLGATDPETYWQAMDQVYRQCLLALRPGGYMAVVIKDYVKNKQRVPLCDQTLQLLEHVGFEPVQRIRAWLVKSTTEAGLRGDITTTKERKSFFRRLAEKKGSPRIDWEEVLIVRKSNLFTAAAPLPGDHLTTTI